MFKAEAENSVGEKSKVLRSDRGGGSFCQVFLQGYVKQLGSEGNSQLHIHHSKMV